MSFFALLVALGCQILMIQSLTCSEEWNLILSSQTNLSIPHDYWMMYQYSGFSINDLGNYNGCNKIDRARYVTFVLSPSLSAVKGVCGPLSCSKSFYKSNQLEFYASNEFEVYFPHKYQSDHYRSYSTGAICMIVFTCILSSIVLFSTLLEYLYIKSESKSFSSELIKCFSLISNVKRIVISRSQTRLGQKDELELLNAVRVFSIGWVILGHTYINYAFFVPCVNYTELSKIFSKKEYIVIYGGFYAVDTFFWLSGLLMTYLFLIEFDKKSSFTLPKIVMVYVHRILRITPVYMFCLLFMWALMPYMGNGPLWFKITETFNNDCHKYWYANLLYMNNFIPNYKTESCLAPSWYLADDMQFFFISPIILIIYLKISVKLAWGIIIGLNVLGIATSAAIAHHFDLNPVIFATGDEYFDYYYVKPYCRVPPYALGIACGIVLYVYRKEKKTGTLLDPISGFISRCLSNTYIRYFIFSFGLSLLNVLIFVQYDTYKHPGDDLKYRHWSKHSNYTFIALERFAYGLALSMILLPCLLGFFKFINWFMSLYIWSFIAKFTFVMYLIHYGIIEIVIRSIKTSYEFNQYNNIRDSFYFFFLSFACAVPIVLVVEMPSGNLEKLILGRMKKGNGATVDSGKDVSLIDIKGENEDTKFR